MKAALTVQNLFVSYYGQQAITNVNFEINKGAIVGIIGPNGAGKSTLLKSILGLVPSDKGEVKAFGKPVSQFRKNIAYVPQRNSIDWDFPISVLDTVLLGTYPRLGYFKRPKKKERHQALESLKRVGMKEFANRQIGELSGGQQQRVFIARALVQKADILFLDEPFVGIDLKSEETIVMVLKELSSLGKTILTVHHDLNKADDYFDQLILLNNEIIGFGSVENVLQPETMFRAYGGQISFLQKIGVNVK